jgi:hypothetical protein
VYPAAGNGGKRSFSFGPADGVLGLRLAQQPLFASGVDPVPRVALAMAGAKRRQTEPPRIAHRRAPASKAIAADVLAARRLRIAVRHRLAPTLERKRRAQFLEARQTGERGVHGVLTDFLHLSQDLKDDLHLAGWHTSPQ